ncbi:hypothetical protein NMY22_g10938 [Coprinellus aureogranulatus]|nr:hypothetical protein NMY22_g10938 [Coprinellus aureogranulatus]
MSETPVCPVRDCTIPIDIVLRSSDGALIAAHKANLAEFSEGFPTPDSVTHSDKDFPVDLAEDGETLERLMLFMHKHRLPNLERSVSMFNPPKSLMALAEGAEKYMVYSAMVVCNIRIATAVYSHPLECLAYAMKFDYPDIADAAAPLTLDKNVEDVTKVLGSVSGNAVSSWVRYKEQYFSIAESILKAPARHGLGRRCADRTGHWRRFTKAVLADIPQSPLDLVLRINRCCIGWSSIFAGNVRNHVKILEGCPRRVCQEAADAIAHPIHATMPVRFGYWTTLLLAFTAFSAGLATITTTDNTISSMSTETDSASTVTSTPNPDSLGITPCILACVIPAATANGCSGFADITCVCSSLQFQVDARACLEAHCSRNDLEAAVTLQRVQCGAVSITPTGTAGPPNTISFTSPTPTATATAPPSATTTSHATAIAASFLIL